MYYKNLILKTDSFYSSFTNGKDYHYLSFFRISVGLIALFDVITIQGDLSLFFSEKSTIIPQDLAYLFTEYFEYLNPIYTFLKQNSFLTIFYNSILWVYLSALLMLIFGLFTRVTSLISLLLQLVIFKSFAVFNFGYDHFLTMSLFYCFIFPIGKFNSIDNLIFRGTGTTLKYNFNYQKIMRIHLGTVYLFAGLAKIISITWWNGEAIWRSVSSIYDNLFKISPFLLATAGIITVVVETGYPFLVANKKTRKITVYTMILMHAFIATMLDLPMFAAIMIVWNITSYYDYFHKPKKIIPNEYA